MHEVLVLYYSATGSVRTLAQSVARGVESVEGVRARVRTVPKVAPVIDKVMPAVPSEGPPYVEARDLEECIAIALGSPTRFGNMAAQMRNFLDQTGGLWFGGKLVGKIGSVFASTATQHGGQETTITSFHTTLLHHGMVIVGLPYTAPGITTMKEVTGGTPYGASSITGHGDEARMPSALELGMCRFQGEHVAHIVRDLVTGRQAGTR